MSEKPEFESDKNGKIVIIGASQVSADKIMGIVKSMGIVPKRIELFLDYNELVHFDYRKLQYAVNYRVFLVGPIPHKTEGTGDYESFVSRMENNPIMYPRVVRLWANNSLKITSTNLRNALQDLISTGYITV